MTVIINGTTGITNVNGSAAAPAETGTDTDTGIVYGTNTLTLSTGGTAGLIQDASQNLGLRAAPSAWGSYYPAIQSNPASAFTFASTANDVQVASNVYQNNSFQNLYVTTGQAATKYIGSATSGAHTFLSSGTSGTAGNQITDFPQVLAFSKNTTLALQGASSVAGTGISFPASQYASSDANTLDDYEEGTWTPTMAGATFTYSTQAGRYVKIGSFVLVQATISATYASSTSAFYINNLPFTVINDSNVRGGAATINCQYGVTFNQYVTGEPLSNQTNMYFENNISGSNRTDMGSSNFASGGFFVRINMTYQVA